MLTCNSIDVTTNPNSINAYHLVEDIETTKTLDIIELSNMEVRNNAVRKLRKL